MGPGELPRRETTGCRLVAGPSLPVLFFVRGVNSRPLVLDVIFAMLVRCATFSLWFFTDVEHNRRVHLDALDVSDSPRVATCGCSPGGESCRIVPHGERRAHTVFRCACCADSASVSALSAWL